MSLLLKKSFLIALTLLFIQTSFKWSTEETKDIPLLSPICDPTFPDFNIDAVVHNHYIEDWNVTTFFINYLATETDWRITHILRTVNYTDYFRQYNNFVPPGRLVLAFIHRQEARVALVVGRHLRDNIFELFVIRPWEQKPVTTDRMIILDESADVIDMRHQSSDSGSMQFPFRWSYLTLLFYNKTTGELVKGEVRDWYVDRPDVRSTKKNQYLRVKTLANGSQVIAFVKEKDLSDDSKPVTQLNGFDITAELDWTFGDIVNEIWGGFYILFANRFYTRVNGTTWNNNGTIWSPFEVKNISEVFCTPTPTATTRRLRLISTSSSPETESTNNGFLINGLIIFCVLLLILIPGVIIYIVFTPDNCFTKSLTKQSEPKNPYKEGVISESEQKNEGQSPSAQPSTSANVSVGHSDTEPKEVLLESEPKDKGKGNEVKAEPQSSPSVEPSLQPRV